MKNLLLAITILMSYLLAGAQQTHEMDQTNHSDKLNIPENRPDLEQFRKMQKCSGSRQNLGCNTDEILIDYGASSGDSDAFIWFLNAAYDNNDTSTFNKAAVAFDSLYDVNTNQPYLLSDYDLYTLDTIFYVITHKNVSGMNDTIVISVVELQNGDPSGNVLWADSLITDSSLTAGAFFTGTFFTTPDLTLTPAQKFGVSIEYFGPLADTFSVYVGLDGNCVPVSVPCTGTSLSSFPGNTWYEFNYGSTLSGWWDNTDIGFPCNGTLGWQSADCELYFIQNMAIMPKLPLSDGSQ